MINMDEKVIKWLNNNQLACDIWNKKYRHDNETFDEWLDRVSGGNAVIRQMILDKKFLFGGRILANRGLQDKQKITFSNCYVIPQVEDSIEGIYGACAQLARTYSYGGGCGLDISNLRPAGAEVHNAAKTTSGAVSFMSSFDEVTKVIGQNGRRGALMISLDINHPDVQEFVNIKTDLNKVTSANISVRVNNEFMQAVKNDTDYILRFPCDVELPSDLAIDDIPYNTLWTYVDITNDDNQLYFRKIRAKELFDNLCYNNWNYAEPGILYWDAIANYNLLEFDDNFEYAGVNPCAEEPLPAGGSCLLGSINLAEFVSENGYGFKTDEFIETVHAAVEALNDVLDEGLALHPLDIQKQTVGDYRQIGLGVFGYADLLIKLGLRYGSDEANEFTDELGHLLASEAIHMSAILAKERGAYKMWTKDVMKSEFFKHHITNDSEMQHIYKLVKRYGLRNSQLLTIAPTGTLSTMLNVSGGAEPIFAKSFNRTTKSLHGEDVTYTVYPTIIQDYLEKTGNTIDNVADYIVSSEDITPVERVKVQGTWQKHIDASISSTVNLPKQTTVDDVKNIYMSAYDNGLKGITVFRAGCARAAILVDTTTAKDANKQIPIDIERGYVKRPKELEADYYQVKVKGEQFAVIVGMLNGKPYEVFTFRANGNFPNHKGKIIKVKKMHYKFTSEHTTIEDLQLAYENIEERAATLYTSMLLRHNTNIKYVVKTAKKVNENISSFSSAMCRILSKYIPAEDTGEKCPECGGKIIRENGCLHCESCGWSMCG
jgi:ribonucleoside-diphosphate reductase alpha chain